MGGVIGTDRLETPETSVGTRRETAFLRLRDLQTAKGFPVDRINELCNDAAIRRAEMASLMRLV